MKKTKHLDFYIKSMEDGMMPSSGLCAAGMYNQIDDNLFSLMEPTNEDYEELIEDEYNTTWWGSGLKGWGHPQRAYTFTPLRQTIVLFMAALNNEL